MECFFCMDDDKECTPFDFDKISEHLIVTEDNKGKVHVHGPIKNKKQIEKFVSTILKEAQIDSFSYKKG